MIKHIYMILSFVCAVASIYGFIFYGFEHGYPMIVLSLLSSIRAKLEEKL